MDVRIQDAYRAIKSAVFGHAAGDALGVPAEFMTRDELARRPVRDMTGFGTYSLPKGAWSDDTSMSLCTLASLTDKAAVAPDDLMRRFLSWADEGALTPFGRAFGIGRTTQKALAQYRRGAPCGCASERDNGNGSLMRILPVVLYQRFRPEGRRPPEAELAEIHAVSALTHAHPRATTACGIYARAALALLETPEKSAVRRGLRAAAHFYRGSAALSAFTRLFDEDFAETNPAAIRSGGYVVDTLEAALWCLLTTESYASCVLKAVSLGEDTDTTAAVAGGLAGLLYGFDAIPAAWTDALAKRSAIDAMCLTAAERWRGRIIDASEHKITG